MSDFLNKATVTSVASSATSVSIVGERASFSTQKRRLRIYNSSTSVLYLRYGTTAASATDFSVKLESEGYLEENNYTGAIQGIWAAANGAAKVTVLS